MCKFIFIISDRLILVFAAFCTPLITPDTADFVSTGNSSVFCVVHHMDMRVAYVDDVGRYHLGYSRAEIEGKSWYTFLSPHDLAEAGNKHKLLCDEKESSATLLVRFRGVNGWLWLYTVLTLKEDEGTDDEVKHMILATYQMLSDVEALTLKASGWLQLQCPKIPKVMSMKSEGEALNDDIHEEYAAKPKRKLSPRSVQSAPMPKLVQGAPIWSLDQSRLPSGPHYASEQGWRSDVGPPTPQTPSQLSPAVYKPAAAVSAPPVAVSSTPLTPDDSPEHHGVICHPQLPQKPNTPPLPIIEPTDLEAYLEEVERDGSETGNEKCVPLPVECHGLPNEPNEYSPPRNLFSRRCSENLGQISHSHFRHAGRLSFSGGCG